MVVVAALWAIYGLAGYSNANWQVTTNSHNGGREVDSGHINGGIPRTN